MLIFCITIDDKLMITMMKYKKGIHDKNIIYLSVYLSTYIYHKDHRSIYQSINQSIYSSNYLSIHPSNHSSIDRSIHLSIYQSNHKYQYNNTQTLIYLISAAFTIFSTNGIKGSILILSTLTIDDDDCCLL